MRIQNGEAVIKIDMPRIEESQPVKNAKKPNTKNPQKAGALMASAAIEGPDAPSPSGAQSPKLNANKKTDNNEDAFNGRLNLSQLQQSQVNLEWANYQNTYEYQMKSFEKQPESQTLIPPEPQDQWKEPEPIQM